MLKKILYPAVFILSIIPTCLLSAEQSLAPGEPKITIFYDIVPVGKSVYQDMGMVEFRGQTLRQVIFKTQVGGFKDTETIYSNPDTGMPAWVERDLSMWMGKEYLTEEYRPQENSLIITKFKKGKKVDERKFKGKGPIHNAIIIPFSLSKYPDLKIGWTYNIRLPLEFKVKLASIDDVTVPAGKFKAYHFNSTPRKFEIWVSADKLRLPIKIKGAGGLPYTLVMKKYIIQPENQPILKE